MYNWGCKGAVNNPTLPLLYWPTLVTLLKGVLWEADRPFKCPETPCRWCRALKTGVTRDDRGLSAKPLSASACSHVFLLSSSVLVVPISENLRLNQKGLGETPVAFQQLFGVCWSPLSPFPFLCPGEHGHCPPALCACCLPSNCSSQVLWVISPQQL